MNKLDREHANDPDYKPFFDVKINSQLELSDTSIPSYGWPRIRETYPMHCRLAQQFRCAAQQGPPFQFSSAARIGTLSRDWHPLGLARRTEEDPCQPRVDPCAISSASWAEVAAQQVKEPQIARAFLIDNYPIAGIRGRYMIDYDDPATQTIADIGAAANAR